jgi:hypothetical protein
VELEKGTPVIVKSIGLRGVVISIVQHYPPGYRSVEVRRDCDGLSAWYLVENLEVIDD